MLLLQKDAISKINIFVLLLFIISVNGCGRSCRENHRGRQMYAYYFGTTDLQCVSNKGKKGKRAASRFVLELTHRFIKYRDIYTERIGDNGDVRSAPFGDGECQWSTESSVAGYGVLSIDCLRKCAAAYSREYGGYNFVLNNCHHYANQISHILCNYNECPSWCR